MEEPIFINYPSKAVTVFPVKVYYESPIRIKKNRPEMRTDKKYSKITVSKAIEYTTAKEVQIMEKSNGIQHKPANKSLLTTYLNKRSIAISTFLNQSTEEKLKSLAMIRGSIQLNKYRHPYKKCVLQNRDEISLRPYKNISLQLNDSSKVSLDSSSPNSKYKSPLKMPRVSNILPKIEGSFPNIYEEEEMTHLLKYWSPTKDDIRLTKKNWLKNLRDKIDQTGEYKIEDQNSTFITSTLAEPMPSKAGSQIEESKKDINYLSSKLNAICANKKKKRSLLRLPDLNTTQRLLNHKHIFTASSVGINSHSKMMTEFYERYVKCKDNLQRNESLIKYKTQEMQSTINDAINVYNQKLQ